MKPRRWFRFSLRTFVLLVALVGAWLGWQARIVQHRKAVFAQLVEAQVSYVIERQSHNGIERECDWHSGAIVGASPQDESRGPSWTRRLLGDFTVSQLGFDRPLTAADRLAIEAFPEAGVEVRAGNSAGSNARAPNSARGRIK